MEKEAIEIQFLQGMLIEAQSKQSISDQLVTSLAQTSANLRQSSDINKNLLRALQAQSAETDLKFKQWSQKTASLKKENIELREQVLKLQQDKLEDQAKSMKEIESLQMQQQLLQEQLALKEQQIEQLQTELKIERASSPVQTFNDGLMKEIKQTWAYITEREEKLKKASLTSLELLKQVKASEAENEQLKLFIMNKKKPYSPKKDDPIDTALADLLNSYPNSMSGKIQRRKSGVYLYGQTEIALKLEEGTLQVVCGRTQMSMESFLKLMEEKH